MYSLIVIRHGESDANFHKIISDKNIDHPLTKLGIKQAQITAEKLQNDNFDLIISSTRQRTQLTAEIINKSHNAKTILSDQLIERDYGIFSGMDKTTPIKTSSSVHMRT